MIALPLLRAAGATAASVKSDLATYGGVETVWKAVQDTGRLLPPR